MVRVLVTVLLLALAAPLAGCVVEPYPGWCAAHPHRCGYPYY